MAKAESEQAEERKVKKRDLSEGKLKKTLAATKEVGRRRDAEAEVLRNRLLIHFLV